MMFAASPKMSPIYFDNWKPGRRDYSQAKEAEQRYLKAAHKKKLPKGCERHHVNWDRSNGKADNIVIATSQDQHNNWHRQMIKFVVDCFNSNLLKFDFNQLKYFVDNPFMVAKIKEARNEQLEKNV